eukprot:gene424-762_t
MESFILPLLFLNVLGLICRGYQYHCDISCSRLKVFGMIQGKQTQSKADGSRMTFLLISTQLQLRNSIMTRKSSELDDPEMDVVDKLKAVHTGGDFEKLFTEGSTFVDKSLFIKEIINDKSEVILITMHRLWGKSLNMNMLRFKKLQKDDYIAIKDAVRNTLIDLYYGFGCLARSSKIYNGELTVKERYQSLLKELKDEKVFSTKLKELTELLYIFHNNTKVWILIDGYDTTANQSYLTLDAIEAQKVTTLFARFLETALKNNDYLYRSVITTGVQYIVKSGILSGLNNFEQYSILDPRYSQYYGLNQKEMDLLLSHFDITDAEQIYNIKRWYNGYREMLPGNTRTEYISKCKLLGGGPINFRLISDFSVNNFQILKEIISLRSNQKIADHGFDVFFFSYLFITGYLTTDDSKSFRLPNYEIRTVFSDKLFDYYEQLYTIDDILLKELTNILQKILDLPQAVSSNDDRAKCIKDSFITEFRATFQSLIETCRLKASSDSTDGIYENEDAIHSILNVVSFQLFNCFTASEMYINKSDKLDIKKDRPELLIRSKSTGIIIEIKYSKKEYSENVSSIQKALEQAKLYSNLIIDHKEKIFIALCVSESKNVSLAGEIQIRDNCYTFPEAEL